MGLLSSSTQGIAMSDNIGVTSILFDSDEILYQYMTSTNQSLLIGHQKVPPVGERLKRLTIKKRKKLGINSFKYLGGTNVFKHSKACYFVGKGYNLFVYLRASFCFVGMQPGFS